MYRSGRTVLPDGTDFSAGMNGKPCKAQRHSELSLDRFSKSPNERFSAMEIEIGQMEIICIKAAMMGGNTSGSNPGCVEALRGSTVEVVPGAEADQALRSCCAWFVRVKICGLEEISVVPLKEVG
jgi:hypothetical protein